MAERRFLRRAYHRNYRVGLDVKRAAGKCEACGWSAPASLGLLRVSDLVEMLHSHHVIPVSCGGPDSPGNIVVLCPIHHAISHSLGRVVKLYAETRRERRNAWVGPQTRRQLLYELELLEKGGSAFADYLSAGRGHSTSEAA